MTVTFNNGRKLTAIPSVLNDLCCALTEAAKYNDANGLPALARYYSQMHDSIFTVLMDNGYFDSCL